MVFRYSDALASIVQSHSRGQMLVTDGPVGGEGRILHSAQLVAVPEPGTVALLGPARLAAARRRKQQATATIAIAPLRGGVSRFCARRGARLLSGGRG